MKLAVQKRMLGIKFCTQVCTLKRRLFGAKTFPVQFLFSSRSLENGTLSKLVIRYYQRMGKYKCDSSVK